MSGIYDQAHQLARTIKQSDEYRQFIEARDIAYESEAQRTLLLEYKRCQFQLQIAMAGGGQADPELMEKFQKIAALLQMSPECSRCMLAEMRLQTMLADIYKILGEAAGVDLDALQRG